MMGEGSGGSGGGKGGKQAKRKQPPGSGSEAASGTRRKGGGAAPESKRGGGAEASGQHGRNNGQGQCDSREQPTENGKACAQCRMRKVKCTAGYPCARCMKMSRSCTPQGDEARVPPLALTIEKTDPRPLASHYVVACQEVFMEYGVDRSKALRFARLWRTIGISLGGDMTHGLLGGLCTLLGLSPLEVEPNSWEEAPPAVLAERAKQSVKAYMEAVAQVKESPAFRSADNGATPLMVVVLLRDGIYQATNAAFDSFNRQSAQMISDMLRKRTLQALQFASYCAHEDRYLLFRTMARAFFAPSGQVFTEFIKFFDGKHVRLYIVRVSSMALGDEDSGEYAVCARFEPVPPSRHVKDQPDSKFILHTFRPVQRGPASGTSDVSHKPGAPQPPHQEMGLQQYQPLPAIPGMGCLPLAPPPASFPAQVRAMTAAAAATEAATAIAGPAAAGGLPRAVASAAATAAAVGLPGLFARKLGALDLGCAPPPVGPAGKPCPALDQAALSAALADKDPTAARGQPQDEAEGERRRSKRPRWREQQPRSPGEDHGSAAAMLAGGGSGSGSSLSEGEEEMVLSLLADSDDDDVEDGAAVAPATAAHHPAAETIHLDPVQQPRSLTPLSTDMLVRQWAWLETAGEGTPLPLVDLEDGDHLAEMFNSPAWVLSSPRPMG